MRTTSWAAWSVPTRYDGPCWPKCTPRTPAWTWDKAVNYAAEQRNRLRTVHGSSPASIVFGALPAAHGLSDEPFNPAAGDHDAQAANQQARLLAAKAFHEANSDRALRASVLARGRPDPASFSVGSYVYYFRAQAPDNKGGKLNPAGRWRGPALVCAIEERANKQDVIWVAHGKSLARATPEQLRPELPSKLLPARRPCRSWIKFEQPFDLSVVQFVHWICSPVLHSLSPVMRSWMITWTSSARQMMRPILRPQWRWTNLKHYLNEEYHFQNLEPNYLQNLKLNHAQNLKLNHAQNLKPNHAQQPVIDHEVHRSLRALKSSRG